MCQCNSYYITGPHTNSSWSWRYLYGHGCRKGILFFRFSAEIWKPWASLEENLEDTISSEVIFITTLHPLTTRVTLGESMIEISTFKCALCDYRGMKQPEDHVINPGWEFRVIDVIQLWLHSQGKTIFHQTWTVTLINMIQLLQVWHLMRPV